MYDHRRAIQAGMEKLLVGFDLQRIRHVAGCIGDHAIGGNDGEGLDTAWGRHAERRALRIRRGISTVK
jgi:hypothetical protein